MRFSAVLLVVTACGTEPTRSGPALDASMGSTSPDGTVKPSGDGGPDAPMQTVCEQAAQHSDLTWIQDNVFSTTCALSSCHSSDSQAAGLVLSKGMSRDSLVNKPSTWQSGWTRVVPGDPAHSYLLVAVGAEPGPLPNGVMMPAGLPMLCSQELGALKRWVAAGAQP